MDSRLLGRGRYWSCYKYRVRWLGYKASGDTWQTAEETGWPITPEILQGYRAFHGAHLREAGDREQGTPGVIDALAGLLDGRFGATTPEKQKS